MGAFADILGVDLGEMASRSSADWLDEDWAKLFGDDELGLPRFKTPSPRPNSAGPSRR